MMDTRREGRWRFIWSSALFLSIVLLYICSIRISNMSLASLRPGGVLHRSQEDSITPHHNDELLQDPDNDDCVETGSEEDEDEKTASDIDELQHLVHLARLPATYIPQPSSHSFLAHKRLIFIGDVHGQLAELRALLSKVAYTPDDDHVIFTGDIVNKGPESAGVVELAMSIDASAVRGNHEDRVLKAWLQHERRGGRNGKERHEKEEAGTEKISQKDLATALSLSAAQRRWLSRRPVILRVGLVPHHGEVVVVHAGLVPGVPLARQDMWAVMNMRTLVSHVSAGEELVPRSSEAMPDASAAIPTDGRDGQAWSEAWNKHQMSVSEHRRTTVIYGHDSKVGLNLHRYSFGIDSNCVKGGQLTALVFEPAHRTVEHRLVSVDCEPGVSSA